MTRETILVTGAGGFVGGTIVEALHFGEEYRVLAGIARWSSAPRVARLPITLVQCDVLKQNELAEAFVAWTMLYIALSANAKSSFEAPRMF